MSLEFLKLLEANVPAQVEGDKVIFTEQGNIYVNRQDGTLIPAGGTGGSGGSEEAPDVLPTLHATLRWFGLLPPQRAEVNYVLEAPNATSATSSRKHQFIGVGIHRQIAGALWCQGFEITVSVDQPVVCDAKWYVPTTPSTSGSFTYNQLSGATCAEALAIPAGENQRICIDFDAPVPIPHDRLFFLGLQIPPEYVSAFSWDYTAAGSYPDQTLYKMSPARSDDAEQAILPTDTNGASYGQVSVKLFRAPMGSVAVHSIF